MNVAVIGSRGFSNYALLESELNKIHSASPITQIVSGGARGADRMGETWAKQNNIPTLIFLPDWDKYGKSAGFIRNKDIIANAELVVAFWDGNSRGTKSSIDIANEQSKKTIIVNS